MSELIGNSKKKKNNNTMYIKNPIPTVDKNDLVQVSMSMNATVNVGDYESVKIMFGLTVPTQAKYIEKTREYLERYIERYLNQKVDKIRKEIL